MTATNQPLIRLTDVKKVFFTDEVETHALSGVYLDINPGEYVAVAGPSGCGKSTLLSILGLLDSPTEGQYLPRGTPVAKLSFSERARIRNLEIGFIFQSFNLIGDLTVFENAELPLTYRRNMRAAERKRRVTAALERVGMSHRQRHFPNQLSGGQQQRVAVARALTGSPAILLADEPTGNLDSENGETVMELLSELHRGGATICIVTHDNRYAALAQRIVHLFDGRIVQDQLTKNTPGSVASFPRRSCDASHYAMSAITQTICFASRLLWRSPGFTLTAIFILALGIGATTAIFSLSDAVILNPLPFPKSDQLIQITQPRANDGYWSPVDYPDFVDIQGAQRSFSSLAATSWSFLDLSGRGEAQRFTAIFTSADLFKLTQLPFVLGRPFTAEEDRPGGPLVVVLSDALWHSRFNSDPNIIGQNLTLSGKALEVIGVCPKVRPEFSAQG